MVSRRRGIDVVVQWPRQDIRKHLKLAGLYEYIPLVFAAPLNPSRLAKVIYSPDQTRPDPPRPAPPLNEAPARHTMGPRVFADGR